MTKDYFSTKRTSCWREDRSANGEMVAGMAIKYQDGYTSWCPLDVFERDYQPTDAMSFGHAVAALKAGERVCRAGWNGKGMFLFYTDEVPSFAPFIAINTGSEVRPWLASQADMLADDWMIVEGEVSA